METRTVPTLSTEQGRAAYGAYWRDLIVDQNNATIPSLITLWKTAVRGTKFTLTRSGEIYRVSHPLGLRSGTRLFMEEVVVRHYFNNIQALVYLGAVVLLLFLALRFAGLLSEEVALIGIGIEALMLLLLFLVLFYAPEEDSESPAETVASAERPAGDLSDVEVLRDILGEIEEIGSSYAGVGLKLERLAETQEAGIRTLNDKMERIRGLDRLETHAERLETTNTLLAELVRSISDLSERVEMLVGKEIEYHVRKELERRISGSIEETRMPLSTDRREGRTG